MLTSLDRRLERVFALLGAGVLRGHQRAADRHGAGAGHPAYPTGASAGMLSDATAADRSTPRRTARVSSMPVLDKQLDRGYAALSAGVRRRMAQSAQLQSVPSPTNAA